jgi:hypothetical protein
VLEAAKEAGVISLDLEVVDETRRLCKRDGVWLTSDIARLPDDTIARFVFHAPLKKAGRQAQELVIRERLRKLRLGKAATMQILAADGISSAQLESATKAARLAVLRAAGNRHIAHAFSVKLVDGVRRALDEIYD